MWPADYADDADFGAHPWPPFRQNKHDLTDLQILQIFIGAWPLTPLAGRVIVVY